MFEKFKNFRVLAFRFKKKYDILKKKKKKLYFEKLKYLRCLLSHNILKKNRFFVCLLFTFSYTLKTSKNIVYILNFYFLLFF